MDELKKLLAEVDDAYEDFVIGVAVRTKKNKEHIENLIKYIKERGGKFILSSDSHSVDTIGFDFPKYEKFIDDVMMELG